MNKKLYQTVIDYINSQINSGELTIGDLIPSESQLSKLLNVSIGTVRKATDKLEHNKVLYRHHGKGTYISDYGFDNSIFNFFSYGNQTGSSIRIYKTTPIRKKVKATSEISFQLGINQGDDVIYLERRGYIDKKNPIIIEKSWWVADVVEGLQKPSLHIPDLLYAVIFKEFDTHIIIGFPGENDADFEESIDFIIKHKPKHVLTSRYMDLKILPAYKLPNKIAPEIITHRLKLFEKRMKSTGIICNSDESDIIQDRFERINKTYRQ